MNEQLNNKLNELNISNNKINELQNKLKDINKAKQNLKRKCDCITGK